MKYVVLFNSHRYSDSSDTPRAEHRIVEALTAEDAREVLRARERVGRRYIGMVHIAIPREDTAELQAYGVKL